MFKNALIKAKTSQNNWKMQQSMIWREKHADSHLYNLGLLWEENLHLKHILLKEFFQSLIFTAINKLNVGYQ